MLPAVCSLGLPEWAWASVHPEAAIDYLKVAIDKTADIGALALSASSWRHRRTHRRAADAGGIR